MVQPRFALNLMLGISVAAFQAGDRPFARMVALLTIFALFFSVNRQRTDAAH